MARKRNFLQAAEKLVSRGKFGAAIKEYEKALKKDPSDTNTLNRVGDLYVRLKRMDRAIERFRTAAEHFHREGFFVKAIAIYKKIIRLDPTRIDIYETLADLYSRQGLTNEAVTQYQVVADYHARSGNPGKVLELQERMVELQPSNPGPRVRLAELYCEADRVPDAMQQYREIASFMLEHDKLAEAVKVYRGAFDLDPKDLNFLADALLHFKEEGYPDAARELLQHAVAKNPSAEGVANLAGLKRSAKGVVEPVIGDEETPAPVEAAAPPAGEPAPAPHEAVEPLEIEPAAEPIDARAEADHEEPMVEPALDADEAVETAADRAAAPEPLATAPSGETEYELDLSELEDLEPEEAIAEIAAEAEAESDLELEPAAEPEPEPAAEAPAAPDPNVARAAELTHEAGILANYDLDDKAVELCESALELDPESFEAHAVLARVYVESDQVDEALEWGRRVWRMAASEDELEVWRALEAKFVKRGYRLVDDAIEAPPAPEPEAATDELEVELVPELADEVEEAAVEEKEPVLAERDETEEETAELAVEETVGGDVVPELEELAGDQPDEPTTAAGDGLDWLEAAEEVAAREAEESEDLFGEEEEFFDLAAELEEELAAEEALEDSTEDTEVELVQPEEQSIEEIVEGFKRGVAETLSTEDYDTHYNLGVAYREMGLLDEAIGEFQLAAKDPRYLVECCSLLGTCFFEKGFSELAVKWYRRGLESPEISEQETLGLLYELGNLQQTAGDREAAFETFGEIYGTNSNYRDVVARLEELKQSD